MVGESGEGVHVVAQRGKLRGCVSVDFVLSSLFLLFSFFSFFL